MSLQTSQMSANRLVCFLLQQKKIWPSKMFFLISSMFPFVRSGGRNRNTTIKTPKKKREVLNVFFFFFFFCLFFNRAFNTHLQTMINVTLRRSPDIRYNREVVKLRDGGQTALDWPIENNKRNPICMLLTGYTGNSQEVQTCFWDPCCFSKNVCAVGNQDYCEAALG